MAENTKIDDHTRQMRELYDGQRRMNPIYATSLDWAIFFPISQPPSWDIFIQTLQSDMSGLTDQETVNAPIAATLTRKIIAEGQRQERNR